MADSTTTQINMDQYSIDYSFDSENTVILCLEVMNKNLGASILHCSSKTLRILPQDYTLNIKYQTNESTQQTSTSYSAEINLIIGQLLRDVTPTLCVVSSRLDERSFEYLNIKCKDLDCKLELQSNQYFKKIGELTTLEFENKEQNFLFQNLIAKKDKETKCTICTVSCILYLYNQHLISDEPFGEESEASNGIGNVINTLSIIDIKDKMLLDDDTLFSLQIFPFNQRMGCDKTISGGYFSLFELLDHTSTTYGKSLLKSWLTFPLTNLDQIKKRYSIIRILIDDQNGLLFDELMKYVKQCPDTFVIVNQLKEGKETLSTWLNLEKFLTKGVELYQIISSFKNNETDNLITKIRSTIDNKMLYRMLNTIQTVIDFELSKEVKKIIIFNNVNERLEELRMIACHIEDLIAQESYVTENVILDVLTQDQRNKITFDRLTNVLFIPELGFLTEVKVVVEGCFSAFNGLGWEEMLRTETDIYFKTSQTETLTEKYGNIYTMISDLEIEILYKLKQKILVDSQQLCLYFEYIGQLDIYQSFAKVCKEGNYIEPELSNDDCSLHIIQSRHPLYETFVDHYIPNDIIFDGGKIGETQWKEHGKERVQILTGPNSSGKSVYLTQIGLIVYMAQIGCFIPAVKAKIGLVDRILTRIRTQESISRLESSFQLDSKQMANALALSTEKSLLLVDEFGKGTDIVDGPALFGAIILYLADKRDCPRTIACTHFHELFNPDVLTADIPGICHYRTEILQSDNINIIDNITEHNVGITFLFTIKKGISTNSLGIYCAKICGMKQEIVERATQLSKRLDEGLDISDEFERIDAKDVEAFVNKQNVIKAFLSWDLDLESNTSSDILKKKLQNILSGEAVPMALNQIEEL